MRLHHWINLGLVAGIGAVAGLGLLPQRQRLAELQARLASAQTAHAPAPASPTAPVEAHPELTLAQKLEQARLRAEVGRLKDRQRTLTGVAQENRRLRDGLAQSGTNQASAPSGPPLPAGYLRRAEARLQGYDTPRHALESFFWAVEHRDTNSFCAAIHPDFVASFAARFESEGAEASFHEFSRIPGYAVSREERPDDNVVSLWLQFAPETPPVDIRLERVDGQWRVRM